MATLDDFKKLELRVGKVISAEKVPETDKLLKLEVSFGELGSKQIIAGIALHFPNPEDLIGKKLAFVANLEPRTIKGLESQGMILATGDENSFSLLNIDQSVPEGSLVR
jgi:methionine--tRNA ligase beta chain